MVSESKGGWKFVGLVSGGKDSIMNIMECVRLGHELVAVAHLSPPGGLEETDSWMYQSVGSKVALRMGECLGVPMYSRPVTGASGQNHLEYEPTPGDEVEDLHALLAEVKEAHPDVRGVSSGAILSDYQRARVENVCSRLSLLSLAYLWRRDQDELLDDMIHAGLEAVLVKVAGMGLNGEHLNKSLSQMREHLHKLNCDYGSHICGEGGEFETITLDCPLFLKRIVLSETTSVVHSDDIFAPVVYLRVDALELQDKHLVDSDIAQQPAGMVGGDLNSTLQLRGQASKARCDGYDEVVTTVSQWRLLQQASGTLFPLVPDDPLDLDPVDKSGMLVSPEAFGVRQGEGGIACVVGGDPAAEDQDEQVAAVMRALVQAVEADCEMTMNDAICMCDSIIGIDLHVPAHHGQAVTLETHTDKVRIEARRCLANLTPVLGVATAPSSDQQSRPEGKCGDLRRVELYTTVAAEAGAVVEEWAQWACVENRGVWLDCLLLVVPRLPREALVEAAVTAPVDGSEGRVQFMAAEERMEISCGAGTCGLGVRTSGWVWGGRQTVISSASIRTAPKNMDVSGYATALASALNAAHRHITADRSQDNSMGPDDLAMAIKVWHTGALSSKVIRDTIGGWQKGASGAGGLVGYEPRHVICVPVEQVYVGVGLERQGVSLRPSLFAIEASL